MPEHYKTWRSIPLLLSVAGCVALLAAAGVAIYWESRLISSQATQLSLRMQENDQLRRRVDRLSRAEPAQPSPQAPAPAPRLALRNAPGGGTQAISAAEHQVERLQDSLDRSNAEVARLQSRLSDLEAQMANVTEENRRLRAADEDLKRGLAEAHETMEKVQTDLKANSSRVQELESANRRLQEESAGGKQSAAQTRQVAAELDGLFRRREMYLNNILRRYKDVTEQYRALAGVLDSRRDRQAAPASGNEISRIQNTIAMAEEDMKQLQALTAQAQRLQKKLPAN